MAANDTRFFTPLFVVSQLFGVAVIVLVRVWGETLGGFPKHWDASRVFNWHPLLMILSLIIIQGDSILIYRALRFDMKPRLKIIHAVLHCIALVVAIIGLKAAFDSHNYKEPPIPNMYSLHSWIGLTAAVLFGIQFLVGFASFSLPYAKPSLRKMLMPLHVFGGTAIFILSILAVLTGIVEKNVFMGKYSELPKPAVIGNVLGLFVTLFGVSVFYLLSNPSYKRVALQGD
ncbi:cytochrome b561 [Galendromus occidentalis]|uniref:Cytochrome b561 n=1 Tax=Galendromus occidentalis TaxID=34638 RepID=A0AAJ6QZ19_9ACAR|nr:cytochrome b561 [Galendromus occidentalis]